MSDYAEDSDYDDDEWLYVEDHYDEVDNLAEHTCPSPVLYETTEYNEYDPYDYWEDLAYLSDGVFDEEKAKRKTVSGPTSKPESQVISKKRKAAPTTTGRPAKRRRGAAKSAKSSRKSPKLSTRDPLDNSIVVWKPQDDREETVTGSETLVNGQFRPVAILKDWEQCFQNATVLPQPARADAEDEEEDCGEEDDENAENEEGFDPADLQSVAGLLSGDAIAEIKKMLKAQGLDPEAVEVVLQDMISGREPEFDDEEEEDDERDGQSGGDGQEEIEEVQATPQVHLPENSATHQVTAHDIAITSSRTGTSSRKRKPVVVETTNGDETEFSSFRPVQARKASPQAKKRKTYK